LEVEALNINNPELKLVSLIRKKEMKALTLRIRILRKKPREFPTNVNAIDYIR
jgi:hypothetical protein